MSNAERVKELKAFLKKLKKLELTRRNVNNPSGQGVDSLLPNARDWNRRQLLRDQSQDLEEMD